MKTKVIKIVESFGYCVTLSGENLYFCHHEKAKKSLYLNFDLKKNVEKDWPVLSVLFLEEDDLSLMETYIKEGKNLIVFDENESEDFFSKDFWNFTSIL